MQPSLFLDPGPENNSGQKLRNATTSSAVLILQGLSPHVKHTVDNGQNETSKAVIIDDALTQANHENEAACVA